MTNKIFIPLDPDLIPGEKMDIVAVGAHADDVDITCGGTLAKLAKEGFKVGIVDLTNAEPTPLNGKYRAPDDYDEDYADVRIAEAKASAKELGVDERYIMDLPNRELVDNFEARCKLATVFRKWKPKVIFQMYNRGNFDSPDHEVARSITDAAKFYSKLTKWEKYMGNLSPHPIGTFPIYYLMSTTTPIHPLDKQGQMTTFRTDITNEIEQKKKALQHYKSQFGGKDWSDLFATFDSLDGAYYKGNINKLYLETFLTIMPLIVNTNNFKEFFFENL